MVQTILTPFRTKLGSPLTKQSITVLQINLGKVCNQVCSHCHVEAGPKRPEKMSPEICHQLIELMHKFPQITTVDLTGGAPEMNDSFKPLVEAARSLDKAVIVRSNLTLYFEPGFEFLPEYFAQNRLRVVASLPCYLEENVDKMRGAGVYHASIRALQWLNQWGYGNHPDLILDLVYNPALPTPEKFSLPPEQKQLENSYKAYLKEHFGIVFNQLLTITNLPIGRTKFYLEQKKLYQSYLGFLAANFNPHTVEHLMCRNELSIDYRGYVYDCDFNQMENLAARHPTGEPLTVTKLLEYGNLDLIQEVQTAAYCYGCTAGCGSSCGGALI